MVFSLIAIASGAAIGAILRWLLTVSLNSLFPAIPPGTLLANLLGGYLVGVAIALFAEFPHLAPEWRLFVITGLLGGLTTFSTFSAEVSTELLNDRWLWAGAAVAAHVLGAVGMTLLGLGTVAAWKHF